MRRSAIWVAAVVGAALSVGLVGCAQPGQPGQPGQSGQSGQSGATGPNQSPTPGASANWLSYAVDVTGVRPGPDPRTVLIDVAVPASGPSCARDPRTGMYTEENATIYVSVVVDSAGAATSGVCPTTAPAVVTLTAPGPIGTRDLVLNSHAWTLSAGGYRKCPADIGCHPPADHCAAAWTLAAFNGLDVPRHGGRSFEHCDQNWLIMTVDANTAVCGAGGRPDCTAAPNVTRYFLRFRDSWQEFAMTRAGGCDAATRADPSFPRELCAELAPTG